MFTTPITMKAASSSATANGATTQPAKKRISIMTLLTLTTPAQDARSSSTTGPAVFALPQLDYYRDWLNTTDKERRNLADVHDDCRRIFEQIEEIREELRWRSEYGARDTMGETNEELKRNAEKLLDCLMSETTDYFSQHERLHASTYPA